MATKKPETRAQCIGRWSGLAADKLLGKTIRSIRYLHEDEMEALGWYGACLVIGLDDGNEIWFSSDDEGNGPGACFTTFDDLPIIPVI